MRTLGILLAAVALLAGCTEPPARDFVAGPGSSKLRITPLGANAAGETCQQQSRSDGTALIYCGTWVQPSGGVREGATADPAQLAALATSGQWRNREIDPRFACAAPEAITILGRAPAELLSCTRRVGGWPQVALVALVGGRIWYADSVQAALPPVERSIGVLSGSLSAAAAPAAAIEAGLLARRLAAQPIGADVIGQYLDLMRIGTRANLEQSYAAAALAFRRAAEIQRKALGPDDPAIASTLMAEALQLSNQGDFVGASRLFARAANLVASPKLRDSTARPRLLHYQALDLLNQGKPAAALPLLRSAEAGYAALVPADLLAARPSARRIVGRVSSDALSLADNLSDEVELSDPITLNALLGVIETRRYEGVALRLLGRHAESDAAIAAAERLARVPGATEPALVARVYRSAGVIAASAGQESSALADLSRSQSAFSRGLPASRPLAETDLLQAGLLLGRGKAARALDVCREAVRLLRQRDAGSSPALMEPCLDAFAAAAARDPGQQQALLGEMFEAAQLAQDDVTSRQIADATARLSENARDPRVAAAVRRVQDSARQVTDLIQQRNDLAAGTPDLAAGAPGEGNATAAELSRRIEQAQHINAQAEQDLQAAAPNYGQLVQQVVPARAVLALLRPDEVFAATELGPRDGWTFALRDGRIAVGRIAGGVPRVAALVARIRASVEPGASNSPPLFDVAASQQLYRLVLGPVGTALDGARALAVAPSGPLLSIPFALLLTGPADAASLRQAPFLIRRMTVAHVPAAANFVSLRKLAGTSRATQPWFGFGDVRPIPLAQAQRSFPPGPCGDSARLLAGLPPLPGAQHELDLARQVLGGSAGDELLGPRFTASAVLHASLKQYRILHFATHALTATDLKCETQPAVVTSAPAAAVDASGALLTASEVLNLDLDADAVILSACNTGSGEGGRGDSLSGLARSFFFAGARSLLVTHWPMNDQYGLILVVSTVQNLHQAPEQGPAVALRKAELALLDSATGPLAEQAQPYYWAPLALIGDGSGAVARLAGL